MRGDRTFIGTPESGVFKLGISGSGNSFFFPNFGTSGFRVFKPGISGSRPLLSPPPVAWRHIEKTGKLHHVRYTGYVTYKLYKLELAPLPERRNHQSLCRLISRQIKKQKDKNIKQKHCYKEFVSGNNNYR